MIIEKATKYKILEWTIDSIFNGIEKNFKKIPININEPLNFNQINIGDIVKITNKGESLKKELAILEITGKNTINQYIGGKTIYIYSNGFNVFYPNVYNTYSLKMYDFYFHQHKGMFKLKDLIKCQ